MTISVTQHTSAVVASGASSLSKAFASAVSAGSPMLIAGVFNGNDPATITVTDNVNAGNYSNDVTQVLATDLDTCVIASKLAAAAGATTVTATLASASGSIVLCIAEVAGIATSAALDKTASANNTSATPNSGNTAATTTANEFVFGFLGTNDTNAETIGAGGWMTLGDVVAHVGGNTNNYVADAWQIVSATGVQAASFTLSVSEEWACLCATYKAAGGGGGGGATAHFLACLGVGG